MAKTKSTDWVTIEYFTDKDNRTLRAGSVKALHRRGMNKIRTATIDEVKVALDKEEQRAKEVRAITDFQDRTDYKDAEAIRNALEWMSPTDHVLDRLTPKQWAELRKKIVE